jgi:thioredoxin reductase (NADPH)
METLFDCIIAGSGPAGMTAALYMCRAGYKTCLITGEEPFGSLGKISLIENFPGIDSISGYDLALKMSEQLNQFEDNKILTRYLFVDALKYTVIGDNIIITLSDGSEVIGKTLIETIGGQHNVLGLSGESEFYGNGISFCATCDGPLYKDKNVTIIGGGNSAMDFALTLSKYCKHVTIIHRRNELRADSYMIQKVSQLSNVKINLNTIVFEIHKNKELNMFELITETADNTEKYVSFAHGIFYALGFKQKRLETDNIKKIDNIFYAGDCIDTKYRQVITACGDGCKAALDCIEYLQLKKGN